MELNFIEECVRETKRAYLESRKNMLWLEHYRLENQNYKDYEGREILELLQNADDAQSSHVEIRLDTERKIFSVMNSGENTRVFSDEGMRSIMASYLSPKKNDGRLIGAKGLGFKSILNWGSEVVIKSDRVSVRFGEAVTRRFWEELLPSVENPDVYLDEARKEGHAVPLPVLRIPEIALWDSPHSKTTVVELHYPSESIEAKIKSTLTGFSPESLLFLHNLRHIKIVIDGDEREYNLKIEPIDGGLEICRINGAEWLVSRDEGEIRNRRYEVAAAFNMDSRSRKESYNIYTFFPTNEEFPFPCILHATLELNASRNAIQTGEWVNTEMMSLLAVRIVAVADRVKELSHGWDAYNLIHGNFRDKNYNGFALLLKDILKNKAASGNYIPVLSGEYADAGACYFYSDDFFSFIKENGGSMIFNNMMLPGGPSEIQTSSDPHLRENIQQFAFSLTDFNKLARFIKILHTYLLPFPVQPLNLKLLRDDNGNVIERTAYLNTGVKIADIPDFLEIKYVAEKLKKALISEFDFQGTEQNKVRSIADELGKCITAVSASDVSGIKKMLMLSRTDRSRFNNNQINRIIECLFNLYKADSTAFKQSRLECCLPTAAGNLRKATELVFGDHRFPDGIENLQLFSEIYNKDELVAFPEFLITEEDDAGNLIQEFYAELGVNKYYYPETVYFGEDRGFLHFNGITDEDVIRNATVARTSKSENYAIVPRNIEKWNQLSLTDLIRLISASGLLPKIIDNANLRYYYNKWHTVTLKINYITYLLQQKTAARKLSNYVISNREWLADADKGFEYDSKDETVLLALRKLGAKGSYADFTPQELYELINSRTASAERSHDFKGLKDFYHRVKVAFVAMGNCAGIPGDVQLRMLCTRNGVEIVMDSREIFYSNNWNSKKLERELPILALQLRDGEDEVNRYFGCRRVKDLKVLFKNHEPNILLSRELNRHLDKCKPYILALTSRDTGDGKSCDRDKRAMTERIFMNVVRSATYYYEHDFIHTEPETFREGEMLLKDRTPWICCRSETLQDALKDPRFCNAVADAICVIFNLSSKDNNDKFYRIVTASDSELKYIAECFDSELWESCQGVFGVTAAEIDFWENVFKANGKCDVFNTDSLKRDKRSYIVDSLQISFERADMYKFMLFHEQQLLIERNRYVPEYKKWLHHVSKDDIEKQRVFLRSISDFQSDEWVKDILTDELKFCIDIDYLAILNSFITDRFGWNPAIDAADEFPAPSIHGEYEWEGLELSLEDKSLLYFDGYKEYFDNLNLKHQPAEDSAEYENIDQNNSSNESEQLEISFIDTKQISSSPSNRNHNHKYFGITRRKLDDADLMEIGNKAEDKVLKAFRKNPLYEIGSIYSRHLNHEGGNDAQGYDLEYRRVGEEIFRCLEIKHFDGRSIIVSRNEYHVATHDKAGYYDVALVRGDEIMIWENAFLDENKYTRSSDDYIISFKATKK